MPIEFRCSQCGKLLRTGDETAGRPAQCPECGALTTIPGATTPSGPTPPLAPLGGEYLTASGTPYSGDPQPGGAYAFRAAPDPFAAQRVSGPATALIVTAILGLVLQVLILLVNLVHMAMQAGARVVPHVPNDFPEMIGGGANVVAGAIGIVLSILVLIGALRMKNLESHSFALAAAILAIIPCTSPCCLLGVPFGIWALVVLNDSSVKAAFRS
jgi:hypothetical protein